MSGEEDSNKKKDGPAPTKSYSEVNQEIRRKIMQAKENWISDRCKEFDSGIRTGKAAHQHSEITDPSTTDKDKVN